MEIFRKFAAKSSGRFCILAGEDAAGAFSFLQ
jgi:hypothetical protein